MDYEVSWGGVISKYYVQLVYEEVECLLNQYNSYFHQPRMMSKLAYSFQNPQINTEPQDGGSKLPLPAAPGNDWNDAMLN